MIKSDNHDTSSSVEDVALIVGGGPGISSSCARLFAEHGMRVAVAARNPDKPVVQDLERSHSVRRYECDVSDPPAVELPLQEVFRDLGAPKFVVHNIDGRVAGILRKEITEADPDSSQRRITIFQPTGAAQLRMPTSNDAGRRASYDSGRETAAGVRSGVTENPEHGGNRRECVGSLATLHVDLHSTPVCGWVA